MTRRMVAGPISNTTTLLRKAAESGAAAVGGMPGSLDPRGVLGSARWFVDGEAYISGRRQRWTYDTGVGRVALTLFDDSETPGWELDTIHGDGTTPARLQTTRARLATGGALALALGLVLVLVVVTSKGTSG